MLRASSGRFFEGRPLWWRRRLSLTQLLRPCPELLRPELRHPELVLCRHSREPPQNGIRLELHLVVEAVRSDQAPRRISPLKIEKISINIVQCLGGNFSLFIR